MKSPEGVLAETVGARARPGDVVVSECQAYPVDAALRYYYPSLPVYSCRGKQVFSPDATILVGHYADGRRVGLDQIMGNARIW